MLDKSDFEINAVESFKDKKASKFIKKKIEEESEEGFDFGDCLVNTNGTVCSELFLALNIAQALSKNTKICLVYDMCRTQTKVSCFYQLVIYFWFSLPTFSLVKTILRTNKVSFSYTTKGKRKQILSDEFTS
mgnify:CR=1 FL=1